MNIFAGIVTYEPELERLVQNLQAVATQVERTVVYDNGSSNIDDIKRLQEQFKGLVVLEGPTNAGIATALNHLARYARQEGASHLLTLDQDSVSSTGMVAELARILTPKVALSTPYIVDRNKIAVSEYEALELPEVEGFSQAARRGAITSGALMNLDVWQEVGGFDDEMFIDYVDYDYNQRVLIAGYEILRANRTYLLHEVGRAAPTWLRVPRKDMSGRWRLERFYAFGHSPQRCYYKARNRILFTRKYGQALGVTHEGVWQLPQQMALTLIFETERRSKMSAFVRGIRDGLRLSRKAKPGVNSD